MAFSGGPDSTALIILATAAGLSVVAHHVDHGHRPETAVNAQHARSLAANLDVPFIAHNAKLDDGANFEMRARIARRSLIPHDAMTGHTLDDRAETMMLRLMRGTGPSGLDTLQPSPQHPIARLRRVETRAICAQADLDPVTDASNTDSAHQRNRVRHELLPLMDAIADRDVAPLLARYSDHVAGDETLLDTLADQIDPTDALALRAAPAALAERALRRWISAESRHHYPPDAAAIERVMAVAHGECNACEIGGGIRVERSKQRLRIVTTAR